MMVILMMVMIISSDDSGFEDKVHVRVTSPALQCAGQLRKNTQHCIQSISFLGDLWKREASEACNIYQKFFIFRLN